MNAPPSRAPGLRSAHGVCETHGDIASASRIENWIDECETRVWFLRETLATRLG